MNRNLTEATNQRSNRNLREATGEQNMRCCLGREETRLPWVVLVIGKWLAMTAL